MKKHCVAKILLSVWETFLHQNNRNYNSYKFSYKFAFILFVFSLTNQKQESRFQNVGGLVTKNICFLLIANSESRSTSKPYRIQQTFIKEFSYMLFLFVLYFHANMELFAKILNVFQPLNIFAKTYFTYLTNFCLCLYKQLLKGALSDLT